MSETAEQDEAPPPEVVDARIKYLQKELDSFHSQLLDARSIKVDAEKRMERASKVERNLLFSQQQTYKELRELGVHEPLAPAGDLAI